MTDYYMTLRELLKNGDVERYTDLENRKEGLYQDGKLIYGDDIASESAIKEVIKPEVHLVLFGAGHIAKAIYDLSVLLGMKITVFDERPEILNEERFPNAERILMPYEDIFKSDFSFFRPYYLILTHGHDHDKNALRYCLNRSYSYLGMIGSKGKVASTLNDLREEGFSDEKLSGVHAPIGLKIGAQSPEEIAISIMAEVIGEYRKDKNLVNISPDYLKAVSSKRGIAVRIIEKRGSAPRAIGSELFVTEDKCYGTIGGGAIELKAEEVARGLQKDEEVFLVKEHRLSSKGDLGMICGGDVTLLYQLRAPK
ncbi:MAG: XdhC family protein [Spirochaetales bacterium]|nr:XdhC family protein [Spirochaetales bacterium]